MRDVEQSVAATGSVHAAIAARPEPSLASAAKDALDAGRRRLLDLQRPDGHWRGELEGDSILQSEYLLVRFILGHDDDPDLVAIANHLRSQQHPDGGWRMYTDAPDDLSSTVKGYFALKLMGDDPEAPHMHRARRVVLDLGGAERCNTFSRFFLAGLGQIPYDACPSIPPEIVFLPRWFYFNLYNVSAWTRTMILPLAIVETLRPLRTLPPERGVAELYHDKAAAERLGEPAPGPPRDWRSFFLRLDGALTAYRRRPIGPLRRRALRAAERWLLERLEGSEGLGAIFPPMVYMLLVFRALGYPDDHPRVRKAHEQLRDFFIREGDSIRIQPCLSPVWDTGIAMHALAETGLSPEDESARRAAAWLRSRECRKAGDWAKKGPKVEPGGWFFEYENPHYPDTDDTAMAIMSLRRLGGPESAAAIERGRNWLLGMQNRDGGWAAFDRTKDRPILERIPFADHNAMQDPSCPDITGRVLEGLGHCGLTVRHPAVQRAIRRLQGVQDPSGAWWGRWGVNYVYGTWQVLVGLRSVGEDMDADYAQRAGAWLRRVQKPDGSFGESCNTYRDPSLKGFGDSTPSQTAWGAMGLMAARGADDPDAARAIRWLIERQEVDGGWDEEPFTGTGFPDVFYLRYHLYRLYFPVMAIGRWLRLRGERADTAS